MERVPIDRFTISEKIIIFLLLYSSIYILGSIFNFLLKPLIISLDGWTFNYLQSGDINIGDSLYEYIKSLFLLLISFLIFTILFVFKLELRFNLYKYISLFLIRLYLLFFMLIYGFAKVSCTQFPFPNYTTLSDSVGNLSPATLYWVSMGYSPTYSIFTGFLELLGGSLLIFRRTNFLGAFILFGVLANVFMLNLSYNIPVKLFSFHLLLLSAILLLSQYKVFNAFFFQNEKFINQNVNILNVKSYKIIEMMVFVSLILFSVSFSILKILNINSRSETPISGIYIPIETKNEIHSNEITKNNWVKFIINKNKYAKIQYSNDKADEIKLGFDPLQNIINIEDSDQRELGKLNYKNLGDTLIIKGHYKNVPINKRFLRINEKEIRLLNEDFQYIKR